MKVMIASEDDQNFKDISTAVKKALPEAILTQMWLIDAGSWFIMNEPEINIIDSAIHQDDAHDLLRLMIESNAGNDKKTIMVYKDEKFKKRCESNGYKPSVWIEYPVNEAQIFDALGVSKSKQKRITKN